MDTPLKALRIERGKSQLQVALAVGITQGNYSRIENGEIVTNVRTARRIARYFGDALTVLQIIDPATYVTTAAEPAEMEKAS